MKREDMKETIKTILVEHHCGAVTTEDASETIVKVFEKSLEESIAEAAKMVPGLRTLLRRARK